MKSLKAYLIIFKLNLNQTTTTKKTFQWIFECYTYSLADITSPKPEETENKRKENQKKEKEEHSK